MRLIKLKTVSIILMLSERYKSGHETKLLLSLEQKSYNKGT